MFEHSKSANTVLKELLEGRKISREQQLQVLENRREILVRCMKTFSQKTLGQLACLDSGNGFDHELIKDNPSVFSSGAEFGLNSRGFFAGGSFNRENDGKRLAFGFDNDSWLLIKVTYFNVADGSIKKFEKADSVEVVRTDLQTILKATGLDPMHVLIYFKTVIHDWVSHRKHLYERAREVEEGMKEESAILCLVT